jgi:hypothetical protein
MSVSMNVHLVGDAGRRPGDPRTIASPSEVNHSEPLFYDDTCNTPSHFLQGKLPTRRGIGLVGVRAEPDRTEGSRRDGWCRRSAPHKRPQGGDGWH